MQSERYGVLLEDGSLRFVRELPGPIERVWSYLVDPEKRSRWLAGGTFSAEPGASFELRFDNSRLTPHDDPPPAKYQDVDRVRFQCEMISCDVPRLLQFLWPEAGGRWTEVTIRLSAAGDRVRLELEHRRIDRPDDLFGAAAGWHVHLGILESRLNAEDPDPFWSAHEHCENVYRQRFADQLGRMRQSSSRD